MKKIWDSGPWEVSNHKDDVRLNSDDFTHDASLVVYGDFRNTREKIQYAKYIMGILNQHPAVVKKIERRRCHVAGKEGG